MFESVLVYVRLTVAIAGLVLVVKPIARLRVRTRTRALSVALAGVFLVAVGLVLPTTESRVDRAETRLDAFVPVWQFHEVHAIAIDAPPARVFEAIKRLRPDEIRLFSTLIAIRGGWQPLPRNVLEATARYESLIDIATHSTFVMLADEAPRELVIGTIVGAPPGMARGRPPTPEMFQRPLSPGFALAAMNYIVRADGPGRSIVSTETRVFANSPAARRRFAVYWRVIYPGSALIRRMSLLAIARRATGL